MLVFVDELELQNTSCTGNVDSESHPHWPGESVRSAIFPASHGSESYTMTSIWPVRQ